jgi:protein-S-isoprenylcysteine O-methyltransferase Ste14
LSLILGRRCFSRVSEYGLAVWLGFFAFVLLYEEPTLRGTFGKEYEDYCSRVPRWIPRFRKQKPSAAD